ncbi:retrovirus-related pol polyprotein from transposon TNT 1-94 [Tanacetum coccineum]
MTPENKDTFIREKEAIFLLNRIGDETTQQCKDQSVSGNLGSLHLEWKSLESYTHGFYQLMNEFDMEQTSSYKNASELFNFFNNFNQKVDPEQAQMDKEMQKILSLLAKYFKNSTNLPTTTFKLASNSRNKTKDTTPREEEAHYTTCKISGGLHLKNPVLLYTIEQVPQERPQSEKPCLYEIPYDNSDHANRFSPEREETMTLENESRSKLNKDKVKPYDYTHQNNLYEIFKGPSLEYLITISATQVKDKVVPNNSQVKFKKKEVEDHHRISSISKKTKSVTACNDSSNSKTSNENAVCAECGTCVFNSNHDACVSRYLKDVNARTKKPNVVPISASKPKRKANKSVATPHKKTVASDTTIQKSKSYYKELYENTNQEWKWWIAKRCPSGYTWTQKPLRTKKIWMPKIRKEDVSTSISPTIDIISRITNIVQLILFIVDSGCTKHMTGNLKLLCNFVEKFLGTVRFGNDQFAPILGYGDLNQGNVTIKRVYYVEGLNHNLFSVGQFCDADLEVAFRKSTCFVRDLQGNDLLTGNRGSDLYTISLQETTSSTPICFMAKASLTQAWLWHRRLSHLNFDYITLLSKKDIVTCLPKLKYVKDQLCSSYEMSKAKRSSFKSKAVPSSKGRLNLLHMDLCGPMRVASINGKKYILVIVDDYSRYTWTLFLRSKDETPEVLKDFLTMIQRNLQAQVISVRTDRGTEFLNKTLHAYFKEEGIEHQTSTPRTPEQNGVVERRNRTLVEAARTMLSASKLPLSFWAEAVATACYTQNRSIIISTHGKTAYHIINDRKPSIKHLHIFGCICYITRDGENPYLMKSKEMMSDHNSSDLAPQRQEMSVENVTSGLVPQGQKASDYDNSDPVPPRQNVVPTAEKTDSSQQGLEFLFSPLLEEYYNPAHGHAEDNNNDQAPNASFQEDEFINPFCTREGVYVAQPEGFVDLDHPEKIPSQRESFIWIKA